MAIPIVVAGIAALSAAVAALLATVGKEAAKATLRRNLKKHKPEIERWAMGKAWEAMGFGEDVDLDHLTPETFTQAINAHMLAGTGLELSNIFSRQAVKEDMQRYAIKHAAEQLGITIDHATIDGLKDALQRYAGKVLVYEIEAGAPELLAHAKDVPALTAAIDRLRKHMAWGEQATLAAPYQPRALLQDEASVSNRRRQAKYRQSHKRRWVPNGYQASAEGGE